MRQEKAPRLPAGRTQHKAQSSHPQFLAVFDDVKHLSLLGLSRRLGVEPIAPISAQVGHIARRAILCANPSMLARAVQPSWVFVRLEWTRHGVNSENPELLIENRYRRAERASNYIPPPLQYEPETWQSTLRCCA